MANLDSLEIETAAVSLNSSDFDSFISKLNPSIVVFDRFLTEEQFGWRVTKNCPDALTILDLEDLHSLRRSRENALRQNRAFSVEDLLIHDDAKRELASIFRSDMTLVISEFEMKLLADTFNVNPKLLHYLPILIEDIPRSENLPTHTERRDFVFIGNFLHKPNADALRYLTAEIWPTIHKRLPGVSLNVYGAYPSEAILQMNNPNANFFVRGRADKAADVVKAARVSLAPLRFGAGIKGKLLEAMQCGTPSVTTYIGAEGMHGDLAWNGFIEDDAHSFAQKAAELYSDENLWNQSQKNGFEIIDRRFMKSDFESDFLEKISTLEQKLAAHRKANFIGSMLRFHTMRSTEYMSRWIEEKNRPR